MIVFGNKIKDKIKGNKNSGAMPAFGGLFARLLFASLLTGLVTIAIVVSGFGVYLDNAATDEAKHRLERSIAVLAPVIDAAANQNMDKTVRHILSTLVDEPGVACVDYNAPVMGDGSVRLIVNLPDEGCQSLDALSGDLHEVSLRSASQGAYYFYIDEAFFADNRNQQLLITSLIAASTLLVVFLLLSFVFRQLVIFPLRQLQSAMMASRPSKPALAEIIRDDEIGALSRTYNKLAAASRIYFARLERSQHSLEESEAKFKDMAEISGDWFYEMDADLRFSYISDRFFEITALQPNDVIGKTRQELMAGKKMTQKWQAHLANLTARETFKSFEYPLTIAGGQEVTLSINGKPLFDKAGQFIGYRGTGSDVSAITRDRLLLEEANRNFGDSVFYASDIQRGLLPKREEIEPLLGEVAVVWQPKDLVGGDFYWVGQIGGARYLVFFDCTGHGVPGAFMTLITNSVLEKIAAASPFALPAAQMLEQIHRGVAAQLGITHGSPGKDGLDCAVLKITASEGQLEFAGASLDLFVANEQGAIRRIRGSRHTLGYQIFDEARQFESHVMPLAGHSFTLLTDGLATQVGDETMRVLGTRRIVEALEKVGDNKPAKLVRTLGLALKRWQGNQERRDDVTMLSFRPYS